MNLMQARFAVLSAMDTYLHASPAVQRAAVRRWQPIAALFSLLWDEVTRKVALSMVGFSLHHSHPSAAPDVSIVSGWRLAKGRGQETCSMRSACVRESHFSLSVFGSQEPLLWCLFFDSRSAGAEPHEARPC